MKLCLYVLGALLFCAPSIFATEESILTSDHLVKDAVDHFLGDAVGGFYDPIRQEPNWWGLGTLGGTAIGSYWLYKQVDDDAVGGTPLSIDDPIGDIVNGISYAAYAMPAIFLGAGFLLSKDDPRRHRQWIVAEELFEALGFSAITAYALKFSVARQNPEGLGSSSFPSGHTEAAFAVATILAYHYPWYVGLSSFALAALVGLERVDAQQHFPSDVAVGAGIGMFFAHAVHQYHASKRESVREKAPSAATAAFLPCLNDGQLGIAWQTTF